MKVYQVLGPGIKTADIPGLIRFPWMSLDGLHTKPSNIAFTIEPLLATKLRLEGYTIELVKYEAFISFGWSSSAI